MSNIQKAVNSILNNNLIEGKKLIQSSLYEKMGKLLEQQLVEFAPSVFNEKMDPVGDEDEDVDNDGDSDESDEYLKNRREKISGNMKEEKDEDEEEEEEDEEDGKKKVYESLTEEELQETLNQIIEQIEKESGYELTQEEIQQVVESFMNQNI